MFQISLTKILVAYLIILLVMLFGVWLIREWGRKRREKEERRCRFICNFCGGAYKNSSRDEVIECPNCSALNERTAFSDL